MAATIRKWIIFLLATICATATHQLQHQEMDIIRIVKQTKMPKEVKAKSWMLYPESGNTEGKKRNVASSSIMDTRSNSAAWWQKFKTFSRRSGPLNMSPSSMRKVLPSSLEAKIPSSTSSAALPTEKVAPAYPYFIQDIERFILRDSIIDDAHLSSSKTRGSKLVGLQSMKGDIMEIQQGSAPKTVNVTPRVQYITPGVKYLASGIKYVSPAIEYVTEQAVKLDSMSNGSSNNSLSSSRVEYIRPFVEYASTGENSNNTKMMNGQSNIDNVTVNKTLTVPVTSPPVIIKLVELKPINVTEFFLDYKPIARNDEREKSPLDNIPETATESSKKYTGTYEKRHRSQKSSTRRSVLKKEMIKQDERPKTVGRMSRRIDFNTLTEQLDASIPGVPNVDYPALKSVPDTNFNCATEKNFGYYADVDTKCQAFHICHGNGMDTFLCPIGTVFNQLYLVCDWWYNVDCEESRKYYKLQENNDEVDDRAVESTTDSTKIIARKLIDHHDYNAFEFDDENLDEFLEIRDQVEPEAERIQPLHLKTNIEEVNEAYYLTNRTIRKKDRNTYFGGSKPFYFLTQENQLRRKEIPKTKTPDKTNMNIHVTAPSSPASPVGDNGLLYNAFKANADLLAAVQGNFGERRGKTSKTTNTDYSQFRQSTNEWWGQAFNHPPKVSEDSNQKYPINSNVESYFKTPISDIKRYIIIRPHFQSNLENDSTKPSYRHHGIVKSDNLVQESILQPTGKENNKKSTKVEYNNWKTTTSTETSEEYVTTTQIPQTIRLPLRHSLHEAYTIVPDDSKKATVTTVKPNLKQADSYIYPSDFQNYSSIPITKNAVVRKTASSSGPRIRKLKKVVRGSRKPKFGDRLRGKGLDHSDGPKFHSDQHPSYHEEESITKNTYSTIRKAKTKLESDPYQKNYTSYVEVHNLPEFSAESSENIQPYVPNSKTDLKRISTSKISKNGNVENKVVIRLGDTITISEAKASKPPKNLFTIGDYKKKVLYNFSKPNNSPPDLPLTKNLSSTRVHNSGNYTVSIRVESKVLPTYTLSPSVFRPASKIVQPDFFKTNYSRNANFPTSKPKILYYDELFGNTNKSTSLDDSNSSTVNASKVTVRHGGFVLVKNEKSANNAKLPQDKVPESSVSKNSNSLARLKMNAPKIYAFFPNDLITRNVTNDIISKYDDRPTSRRS